MRATGGGAPSAFPPTEGAPSGGFALAAPWRALPLPGAQGGAAGGLSPRNYDKESRSALELLDFKNAWKQFQKLVGKLVTQKTKERLGLYIKDDVMERLTEEAQIFGYFTGESDALSSQLKEENVVFLVSKNQQITFAAVKRQDVIKSIVKVPHLDFTVTSSQKGVLTIFNNQDTAWITGCDFLPQLKCVVAVTGNWRCGWDHRVLLLQGYDLCRTSHCWNPLLTLMLEEYQDHSLNSRFIPVKEFHVRRRGNTFTYCRKAKVIVTNFHEKLLCLWHPAINSRPTGKLSAHHSIVEIVTNEEDRHVVSLSSAKIFSVWDIQTISLLQVSHDNQQSPGEMEPFDMVFDSDCGTFITSSAVIDIYPLTHMIQDTRQVPQTHEKSIKVLIYNRAFHQILAICSESILKVWDLETGYQIYQIEDIYQIKDGLNTEVICAAIEINVFCLPTGGNSVQTHLYVTWVLPEAVSFPQRNPVSSLSLKPDTLQTHDFFPDIQLLSDTSSLRNDIENFVLSGDMKCFDVLKIEGCSLIATGSANGAIILWGFESVSVRCLCEIYEDNQASVLQASGVNTMLFPVHGAFSSSFRKICCCALNKVPPHRGAIVLAGLDKIMKIVLTSFQLSFTCICNVFRTVITIHQSRKALTGMPAKGNTVKELLPFSKYPSVPLTALCTDVSTKMLLAGSKDEHIRHWSIASFLEDPQNRRRAHSTEVVDLLHEEEKNVVVTASIDGSVKLWHAMNRRFLDYFGQPRKFELSDTSRFILPCDVNNFLTIIKEKIKHMEKKFQCCLTLDRDKSSLIRSLSALKKPKHMDIIQDLKFFKALASAKLELKSFTVVARYSCTSFVGSKFHGFNETPQNPVPQHLWLPYSRAGPKPSSFQPGFKRGGKFRNPPGTQRGSNPDAPAASEPLGPTTLLAAPQLGPPQGGGARALTATPPCPPACAVHAGTCSPPPGRGQCAERALLESPARLPRATAERSGAERSGWGPGLALARGPPLPAPARYWRAALGGRVPRRPLSPPSRAPAAPPRWRYRRCHGGGAPEAGERPRGGRAAVDPLAPGRVRFPVSVRACCSGGRREGRRRGASPRPRRPLSPSPKRGKGAAPGAPCAPSGGVLGAHCPQLPCGPTGGGQPRPRGRRAPPALRFCVCWGGGAGFGCAVALA
ncbi:LOW QUALITY PROTEIN: WD repeat-containing protein 64 [Leptosomus discolor]